MEMKGLWGAFYKVSVVISRLAYLNLLWIFATILGLVVVGIMPATISMFTVVRKWVMKENDIPIFKTFFSTYKKEFLKTNLIMIILGIIGVLLFIDLRFTGYMRESGFYNVFLGILFIASFLYFILVVFIAPVYVHYQLSIRRYLTYSIMIGATNLLYTIAILIALSSIYYTSMKVPGITLFFSFSVSAYITMYFANLSFNNLLKKQQAQIDSNTSI
ncbi:YesL family protein [Paraliobacillus sediminis]|uniref:YesL family protein n=1 Tax=Paraliobacillus sediminis TaxID=1885916 RepID=UPI000E3D6D10|nr:DUF624 domain-containing protein [Paraliobacillus sediminis]